MKLVSYIFPVHLEFLELSFTPGANTATVRTKKPLDADVLASVSQETVTVCLTESETFTL